MKTLGNISRFASRMTGGKVGQTVCGRIAARYGHDCLFCKFVGWVLRDEDHCWTERLKDLMRS